MEKYYISSTKFTIQERKTKKNGTVYDVVFRIISMDGIEKQKKLSGFNTKTLAKQAHADFVMEYCELVKNNPVKKKNTQKQEPTVGELVASYIISLHNQVKDSTIYDKDNAYKLFVLPKYKDTKITDLTKDELYNWQDELWNAKNPKTSDFYSHAYLSKTRSHFSSFLDWCNERYGYINYFTQIKKPKRRATKPVMDFWTREEFDKFIKVVDNPTWHCLFTLMFFTGRRKGELFALTPEDVKKTSITFDKSLTRKTTDGTAYKITTTKKDKVQEVPICQKVIDELKNYKHQSPFLFGGEKPLAENTVTRAFQSYCNKAGVKIIRIHDLRHSFVSMMIHLGINLMVVADLIGDTVEQVTKTYGHLYVTDKREAVNRII